MQEHDVHEQVAKAYTKALEKTQKKGSACCAPPCCPPAEASAVKTAGYDAEMEAFPEAGASSFGCGNPLAFAGVALGETVLDLGSGAGLDLLIAAEKVGETGRVIGVDMTDVMIEAARNNATRAGFETRIEIRKGHIEALPVDDSSVDWVISNCVINLSPDKTQVFSEIARVLKPGARFSVSDIVVGELPTWLLEHEAAYSACVSGAISEDAYLEGLRSAGLVEVQVEERLVYEISQITALIAHDLESAGLDDDLLTRGMSEVEGKVASVKVVGRLPH